MVYFPSAVLVEPVTKPLLKGRSNKDVITFVEELVEALSIANTRLASIKEFKETSNSPSE